MLQESSFVGKAGKALEKYFEDLLEENFSDVDKKFKVQRQRKWWIFNYYCSSFLICMWIVTEQKNMTKNYRILIQQFTIIVSLINVKLFFYKNENVAVLS